jgi:ketosteroid isomerase-like protein
MEHAPGEPLAHFTQGPPEPHYEAIVEAGPRRSTRWRRKMTMTIEDEIRANNEAFNRALLANDAAAVAEFMSDDWIYVGPGGITQKAELIGWIASGRLAHHSFELIGEERIAIHDGTVLVTARRRTTGTWEGISYSTHEWLSEVYMKVGSRWLCFLSHRADAEGD